MAEQPHVHIGVVQKGDVGSALALAFSHVQDSAQREQLCRRFAERLSQQPQSYCLLEAVQGGKRVGVLWLEFVGRYSAILERPVALLTVPGPLYQRLIEAAESLCHRRGLKNIQVMLREADREFEQLLGRLGYRFICQLFYLMCSQENFPDSLPDTPLKFVPLGADQCGFSHLSSVVEATWKDTLDCPELGQMPVETVLDGFRATGEYDPRFWFLVFLPGVQTPVGCLLLNRHEQDSLWEIVYMGLVREVRGQGYGTQLVRFAQWVVGQQGGTCLAVGVDGRNLPAVRSYLDCGFQACQYRYVYQKLLD